jgi:hypothetical protein
MAPASRAGVSTTAAETHFEFCVCVLLLLLSCVVFALLEFGSGLM